MHWTGPKQGKLRIALLETYPDIRSLKRFVKDHFEYSLAGIGGFSPEDWAEELLDQAVSEGWIDDLYDQFCKINHSLPRIAQLQKELQAKPLIEKNTKLTEADWQALFSGFSGQDFGDVQKAFLRAFKATYQHEFGKIRPDHPALSQLEQVQSLLESFDNPDLAVRFVEFVIVGFQQDGGQNRDLSALEQWRDRIAQTHQVDSQPPQPVSQICQGYLLVSLQPSGRQTQKQGAFVNLFAELQVAGAPAAIEFGACSITCSFDEVADHLSGLIRKAEVALIPYECSEIVIELFLPCKHLEENVAAWQVKNEQDRLRDLGRYRRFLVRSFERATNPSKRLAVRQKWQLLESSVATKSLCSQIHAQRSCPKPGDLEALLSDKPGLRLLAALPDDLAQRTDILYDIINSAVPIALWCSQLDGCSVTDLEAQFNQFLGSSQLTDFFQLAQQWRIRQIESENQVIKPIRLLCDCPDRWPDLPDPTQEDDLLVAS
jgi:hypothetical protein